MKSKQWKDSDNVSKNMLINFVKTYWRQICFIIIIIIIIMMNLINVLNINYWGDECYSIKVAQMSIEELIAATAQDVHPPLYYICLRISYLIFGNNVWAWRLPSVIPVILLIIFAATVIRKKHGKKVALLFVILTSFLQCCLRYNVEVRMYSLGNFFVFICFWYGCELISSKQLNNKMNWFLFTLFGILAAYTHYYALLIVALIYFAVFAILITKDRKNLKKSILCGILCIIAYIPWINVLIKSFTKVKNSFWLDYIPSIKTCLKFLIGNDILGKTLCILILLSVMRWVYKNLIKMRLKDGINIQINIPKTLIKRQNVQEILLSIFIIFGIILIGITISKLIRPLLVTRYLFSLMGIACLSISIIIFKSFTGEKIGYCIILIAIILGCYSWGNNLLSIKEQNEQTEELVTIIEENWEDGSIIVTDVDHLSWTVLKYYFNYPYYNYENLDMEDYKENTCWLILSSEINEEFQEEIEKVGGKISFIESNIFAGRYDVLLYKIYW